MDINTVVYNANNGRPLGSVRAIRRYPNGGIYGEGVTDSKGYILLRVPENGFTVDFSAPGFKDYTMALDDAPNAYNNNTSKPLVIAMVPDVLIAGKWYIYGLAGALLLFFGGYKWLRRKLRF